MPSRDEYTGDKDVASLLNQCSLPAEPMNASATDQVASTSPRVKRLVHWNVEILSGLIKDIIARRMAHQMHKEKTNDPRVLEETSQEGIVRAEHAILEAGSTAVEEVREIIRLPVFIAETADLEAKIRKTVELDPLITFYPCYLVVVG